MYNLLNLGIHLEILGNTRYHSEMSHYSHKELKSRRKKLMVFLRRTSICLPRIYISSEKGKIQLLTTCFLWWKSHLQLKSVWDRVMRMTFCTWYPIEPLQTKVDTTKFDGPINDLYYLYCCCLYHYSWYSENLIEPHIAMKTRKP